MATTVVTKSSIEIAGGGLGVTAVAGSGATAAVTACGPGQYAEVMLYSTGGSSSQIIMSGAMVIDATSAVSYASAIFIKVPQNSILDFKNNGSACTLYYTTIVYGNS